MIGISPILRYLPLPNSETDFSFNLVIKIGEKGQSSTLDYNLKLNVDVIPVNDLITPVVDTDTDNNLVLHGSANNTEVQITAFSSDVDVGVSVTYSLSNNANGLFKIDASTGVVTVADASRSLQLPGGVGGFNSGRCQKLRW